MEVQQFLIPKTVYIGEKFEVHYSFESENLLVLPENAFPHDTDDFSLLDAALTHNAKNYSLVLTINAWKTGTININDFYLIDKNLNQRIKIDFLPIEISSVLENARENYTYDTQKSLLKPILLPGTKYFIYGIVIFAILLLIFLARLAFSYRKIVDKIKTYLTLRRYAKNKKATIKKLKQLEKNAKNITDKEYGSVFENIMRSYLSVKFGIDFSVMTTNQFMAEIDKNTQGLLSDNKKDEIANLVSFFSRIDYIKFAHNSLDSSRIPQDQYDATFKQNEQTEIIEKTRKIIEILENV